MSVPQSGCVPRRGLVQRDAVEAGQRPLVPGEVRGHPVDDDADARLVQPVHQVAELIRGAEPGRRRVVRGHLVAPGPAEGVLGDRQELHVREPEAGDVRGELVGELGVGETGAPRAQVNLVRAHRPAQRVAPAARGHPGLVAPFVAGFKDHGGGSGRPLGQRGHRVGLPVPASVRPADVVLVARAGSHLGHEQLPDAGRAQRAHRVRAPVPVIEVADHPHAARVRGPHRERGAVALLADVGAENLPQLLVPALPDQVQVDLAERRQVPVRVVGDGLGQRRRGARRAPVGRGRRVGDGDPVVGNLGDRERGLEHALVHVGHGKPASVGEHDRDRGRQRAERAHDRPARARVRSEDRVRVVMQPVHDLVDLGVADRGRARGRRGFLGHQQAAICSSGIGSQDGRCRASYTTSYTALSSISARSSAAWACGSIPPASA
jgi:hypothetical protein